MVNLVKKFEEKQIIKFSEIRKLPQFSIGDTVRVDIKIIEGACFSASSNTLLRFFSDSPCIFDKISGPLIINNAAPVSLAIAFANKVLPEPGGP